MLATRVRRASAAIGAKSCTATSRVVAAGSRNIWIAGSRDLKRGPLEIGRPALVPSDLPARERRWTSGVPSMRQVLVAFLAFSLLSACTATVEPPKAKIVVPAIAPSPGFCPPGQAKKGNC